MYRARKPNWKENVDQSFGLYSLLSIHISGDNDLQNAIESVQTQKTTRSGRLHHNWAIGSGSRLHSWSSFWRKYKCRLYSSLSALQTAITTWCIYCSKWKVRNLRSSGSSFNGCRTILTQSSSNESGRNLLWDNWLDGSSVKRTSPSKQFHFKHASTWLCCAKRRLHLKLIKRNKGIWYLTQIAL